MKVCRTCGAEKPIEDYYNHPQMLDGHLNICKECIKNNVRTRRQEFPDKVRAYDMSRAKDPRRIALKRETVKRRRQEVPGYMAAHNAVEREIRTGRIKKPSNCEACGYLGRVEGHHQDYSKPLEIMWLCVTCHRRLHLGKTDTAEVLQAMIGG